jgi:hypothetical protein
MNSFYAQMLLAIQNQIKQEVPEIRYIDQDLGQLEFYDERPSVSWPCLLIDFSSTTYDQIGQQVQWGKPVIQARLGFAPFSSANSLAPLGVQQKALAYYEIELRVYQALQGFTGGDLCQPLTRIKDGAEKRNDPFRVRVMIFDTTFEDDSASQAVTSVPRPPLNLDMGF